MASIFRKDDNFVDAPKRNTLDGSYQTNVTTDFGSLRPVMCKPVYPGDSFSIDTTFGLRFMPLTFPIQTRMNANIHFFYVRNRNLWKDWQDFIGKTKENLTPPYIRLTELNRDCVHTGKLGDYLGVPTQFHGTANRSKRSYFSVKSPLNSDSYLAINNTYPLLDRPIDTVVYETNLFEDSQVLHSRCQSSVLQNGFKIVSNIDGIQVPSELYLYGLASYDGLIISSFLVSVEDGTIYNINQSDIPNDIVDVYLYVTSQLSSTAPVYKPIPTILTSDLYTEFTDTYTGNISAEELLLSQLPWRSNENPDGIPLSALPFRAYESVYNSFYRNPENNPLIINGVPEYNKWIRSSEGGADEQKYEFFYRNWEDDFLTTALPSPQQGNAPLVGLSGSPNITIAHDDGTTTTANLTTDEDGNVVAVNSTNGDAVTSQALIDAVSYGITINDFRNVNAFQRWLENNIRRGYKYKDQIKTHYGVSVRYDELDMPEFIGGVSRPVMVNQISQTVPLETSPLGDMAGQASVVGSGKPITHYCDEHGFIIGILSVTPVANYSQLLPKHFNVTDAFDYYFPEFGHIGMQPIYNWEVAPIQAHLEGKLNDVFGYQRAWYDLLANTDEVHGLFRTELRNFLLNRTFDSTPELGKDFTTINPEHLNEVFAYTDKTDKIIGQIFFDLSMKRPIPLYGIPKLE